MLWQPKGLTQTGQSWRRPQGSAAWTPASLTNLIGWWEARLGVTESSGAVSQWDDQSGVGNHMVQATGANKPAYSATSFNSSYPGLTFNKAAPSYLRKTTATLASTANFSIFVLLDLNGDQDAYSGIVSFVEGADANDYNNAGGFVLENDATATDVVEVVSGGLLHSGLDTSGNPSLVGITAAVGSPNVGYLNGSSSGSSNNDLPANIGGASGGDLAFATRPWNGFVNNTHGVISLIVMGAAVWDVTEIGLLKDYCNTHYGTSF